jgi:hypothetical protein
VEFDKTSFIGGYAIENFFTNMVMGNSSIMMRSTVHQLASPLDGVILKLCNLLMGLVVMCSNCKNFPQLTSTVIWFHTKRQQQAVWYLPTAQLLCIGQLDFDRAALGQL